MGKRTHPAGTDPEGNLYYRDDDIEEWQLSTVYRESADSVDAADVSYDNTSSGLAATTAQAAVDEVASGTLSVVKLTAESVTSSTTLQDDDELVLPIGANQTMAGRFLLFIDTGDESADIKVDVSAPDGATVTKGAFGRGSSATSPESTLAAITSASTLVAGIDGAFETVMEVFFSVVNGATAGDITLQWAQNASSATPTTVKAGSYGTATVV